MNIDDFKRHNPPFDPILCPDCGGLRAHIYGDGGGGVGTPPTETGWIDGCSRCNSTGQIDPIVEEAKLALAYVAPLAGAQEGEHLTMTIVNLACDVIRGEHLSSQWMAGDIRLFTTAFGGSIHPGTINLRIKRPVNEDLPEPIMTGGETVNPGALRAARVLTVRDCKLDGQSMYMVKAQRRGEELHFQIIGNFVKNVIPGAMVMELSLDTSVGQRTIPISYR